MSNEGYGGATLPQLAFPPMFFYSDMDPAIWDLAAWFARHCGC